MPAFFAFNTPFFDIEAHFLFETDHFTFLLDTFLGKNVTFILRVFPTLTFFLALSVNFLVRIFLVDELPLELVTFVLLPSDLSLGFVDVLSEGFVVVASVFTATSFTVPSEQTVPT